MFLCPILTTSDPYVALQKICADIPGYRERGGGDWKAKTDFPPEVWDLGGEKNLSFFVEGEKRGQ